MPTAKPPLPPMAKLQIDIPQDHFELLRSTYTKKGYLTIVIRKLIAAHVEQLNKRVAARVVKEEVDGRVVDDALSGPGCGSEGD